MQAHARRRARRFIATYTLSTVDLDGASAKNEPPVELRERAG
jgi:hypothetical protein